MYNNKAIVALLIKMIKSDQHIDPLEKKYVFDAAVQLGLNPDDVITIAKNPEAFPLDNIPPEEQDRMTILYYVMFAMSADEKIDKAEEAICYKLGLRLGFNEKMCQDFINVLKNHLGEQLPPNALVEVIRKYLN